MAARTYGGHGGRLSQLELIRGKSSPGTRLGRGRRSSGRIEKVRRTERRAGGLAGGTIRRDEGLAGGLTRRDGRPMRVRRTIGRGAGGLVELGLIWSGRAGMTLHATHCHRGHTNRTRTPWQRRHGIALME